VSDTQALKNISKNVVRLRGQRSQYWLAKQCDTYPANIARIESGDSMPGGGLLSRIAEALDTTVDYLLADHLKKSQKTG
jgi:transcriptional regulator with XRE-family HTH domain